MANGIGITEGSGKTLATLEKLFTGVLQHQQVTAIGSGDGNTYLANVDVNGNLQVNVSGLKNGVATHAVSVANGTTPTQLTPSPLANRVTVLICNESDTTVRVGPSTVTVATIATQGYPIFSGQTLSLDVSSNVALYAVHAAGVAKVVTVMEIG